MKIEEFKKVLIIQTAFIGDVILATPVIETLHKFFPELKIDFLLRKGNESLFHQHPFLHNILIWNKKGGKYKDLIRLLGEIRNEKYDLIINLHRFGSSGFLTTFSGAKIKIGFDKNPFSIFYTHKVDHIIGKTNTIHEVDRNLSLLKSIGISHDFAPIKLHPSADDFTEIQQYTKNKFILIAPSSVWFTKQFPPEKWSEFLQIVPIDYEIFFIGAPEDYDLSQKIIQLSSRKNCLNLCGKLSFLQSAALMTKSEMNYVNDSAPMHIASAVNAPTTAIFCSTLPEFGFGPLSEKSNVVQIKESLECRPCGLHGKKACPKEHFNCANKIDAEDIIKTLSEK